MKRLAVLFLMSLLAAVLVVPAMAEYPDKPITYQIPFGPGGQSDLGGPTPATSSGKRSRG